MEHVKAEEFDSKILKDGGRTIVLFYATWCPFCTDFRPTFESLGSSEVRKVGATIDEDENPLWDRFDIRAVPTMIAFEGGRIIARRDARKNIGLSKKDMESMIADLC